MGRVYSAEQVSSGQLPQLGAHEAAGNYILDKLFEPVIPNSEDKLLLFDPHGQGVDSAMVYGSTAYGTAGRRSDLDILIFYMASQSGKALETIASVLKQARDEHAVAIEQNILPVGAVYNDREHGLDPLFAGHLLEINAKYGAKWCRNNPTGGLKGIAQQAEDPYAVNSLAHGYCSGRLNFFAKALSANDGKVNYDVFQRALELPSAIGRKAVAATMEEDADPLDLSSRPSMQQRARSALMATMIEWDQEPIRQHDYLYGLDQEYSELLEQAAEGNTSIDAYDKWLQSNYIESCKEAHSLSRVWVDIFRARRKNIHTNPVRTTVDYGSFDGRYPASDADTFTPTSYN